MPLLNRADWLTEWLLHPTPAHWWKEAFPNVFKSRNTCFFKWSSPPKLKHFFSGVVRVVWGEGWRLFRVGLWRVASGYVWRPWSRATAGRKRRLYLHAQPDRLNYSGLQGKRGNAKIIIKHSYSFLSQFFQGIFRAIQRGQTDWTWLHLFSISYSKSGG